MSWFGTSEGTGLRDAIETIMWQDFSETCLMGGSIIGRANAMAIEGVYPWVTVSENPHSPYGGAYGTHTHWESIFDKSYVVKREEKELWGEFLEMLDRLEGYPIVSDDIFSQLESLLVDEELVSVAKEYAIDPDMFNTVYHESGACPYVTDDYVSLDMGDETLAELVDETRRRSQNWDAHFTGSMWHEVTHCLWCLENEELERSKANAK
jgi:hypothetical protein